jgi:hypothetical protein
MKEAPEKRMKDVREHLHCLHPKNVWISSQFASRKARDLVGTGRSFQFANVTIIY